MTLKDLQRKLATLKSLGPSTKIGITEMFQLSPSLSLGYDTEHQQIFLKREIEINGTPVAVILDEDGIKAICVEAVHFIVNGYGEEFHRTFSSRSDDSGMYFFLGKGIFVSSTKEEKEDSSSPFTTYIVKINKSVRLDFDDTPDCLLKYFKSIVPGRKLIS